MRGNSGAWCGCYLCFCGTITTAVTATRSKRKGTYACLFSLYFKTKCNKMKFQVLLLLFLFFSTSVVLTTRGPYRYNNPNPNQNATNNEDNNWDDHNFFLQPVFLDDNGVPIDPESGMMGSLLVRGNRGMQFHSQYLNRRTNIF